MTGGEVLEYRGHLALQGLTLPLSEVNFALTAPHPLYI